MKLEEALNNYKNNKDKTALYEAVAKTSLNYNEKQEVLRDTLGEEFSNRELVCQIALDKIQRGLVTDTLSFEEWED